MLVVAVVQLAAAPAVWLGRWWGFWVCLISVVWHMVAAIMFAQDYLGLAIALPLLDAVVLASLLAAAARPRPTATGYWA